MCSKDTEKVDQIVCVPRSHNDEDEIEAAEIAIDINPQNGFHVERMMQQFSSMNITAPNEADMRVLTAVNVARKWGKNPRLAVSFVDQTPNDLKTRILSHLNAWGNRGSGIRFSYSRNVNSSHVRINREFQNDPDWDGYWSFLGTDVMKYQGPNGQTMNLQGFTMQTDESEYRRVVRHEGGHALGFPHEHLRKELIDLIDKDKAIKYFKRMSGWDEKKTIRQVLTPISDHQIHRTVMADPNSIMAYRLPDSILKAGATSVPGGNDINENDYWFAKEIY